MDLKKGQSIIDVFDALLQSTDPALAHVRVALGVDRVGAEHRHDRATGALHLVRGGPGHPVSPGRPS